MSQFEKLNAAGGVAPDSDRINSLVEVQPKQEKSIGKDGPGQTKQVRERQGGALCLNSGNIIIAQYDGVSPCSC
jgi:hypothetical protein